MEWAERVFWWSLYQRGEGGVTDQGFMLGYIGLVSNFFKKVEGFGKMKNLLNFYLNKGKDTTIGKYLYRVCLLIRKGDKSEWGKYKINACVMNLGKDIVGLE